MWAVGPSGNLASRARRLPHWARSMAGSLQTPETRSVPWAASEGSSTRTSPPWGVSQLRTLRRPGRPRIAPRASPTSRWCVWEGPRVALGWSQLTVALGWSPLTVALGWSPLTVVWALASLLGICPGYWGLGYSGMETLAARLSYSWAAAGRWGCSRTIARQILPPACYFYKVSLSPPPAQRAVSGAEGASYTPWAAGQLWR